MKDVVHQSVLCTGEVVNFQGRRRHAQNSVIMPEHMLPSERVLSESPPPVAGKFRVAQMSRGACTPSDGPPVAGAGSPVAEPSAGGGKLLRLGGGRRIVLFARIADMPSGRGNQRMIGNFKNQDPLFETR